MTLDGSEHQMTLSGAVLGLTLVTTRSLHLSGNFSASLRLVSNMNCSIKLLRPIEASRSMRSSSSNLSGSVGFQTKEELLVDDGDDICEVLLDDDAIDDRDDGVVWFSQSSNSCGASKPS